MSIFPNLCACPVKCEAYFSGVVIIFAFLDLEQTISFSDKLLVISICLGWKAMVHIVQTTRARRI